MNRFYFGFYCGIFAFAIPQLIVYFTESFAALLILSVVVNFVLTFFGDKISTQFFRN